MTLSGEEKCGICFKELIRGDYVYGACHDCAKHAISQRLIDVFSYSASIIAEWKRNQKGESDD